MGSQSLIRFFFFFPSQFFRVVFRSAGGLQIPRRPPPPISRPPFYGLSNLFPHLPPLKHTSVSWAVPAPSPSPSPHIFPPHAPPRPLRPTPNRAIRGPSARARPLSLSSSPTHTERRTDPTLTPPPSRPFSHVLQFSPPRIWILSEQLPATFFFPFPKRPVSP